MTRKGREKTASDGGGKPRQPSLLDGHKNMTLLDLLRESGKLRRRIYGKMAAHERKKSVEATAASIEKQPLAQIAKQENREADRERGRQWTSTTRSG
jgi:hypothetical protein